MFELTTIKQNLALLAEADPIPYAIPVFVVFLLLELGFDLKENRHLYQTKDALASISMGIGSIFVNLFCKIMYFTLFTFLYQRFHFFDIKMNAWESWLVLFFLDDLTFYWFHRSAHQIEFLWAGHSNHHSSEYYNYSTALRQSWSEFFFKYIFWLPIIIIGFPPIMVFTMISINLIYQFFMHTSAVNKLGFIEKIFNSPSHHRVHHATNVRYLDKNHAGTLIIWDKMFGTFQEEDEKPVFGLTTNIKTFNPFKIAVAEYKNIAANLKKAPHLSAFFAYLYKSPGWSHDGSSLTSEELLKKSKLEQNENSQR